MLVYMTIYVILLDHYLVSNSLVILHISHGYKHTHIRTYFILYIVYVYKYNLYSVFYIDIIYSINIFVYFICIKSM